MWRSTTYRHNSCKIKHKSCDFQDVLVSLISLNTFLSEMSQALTVNGAQMDEGTLRGRGVGKRLWLRWWNNAAGLQWKEKGKRKPERECYEEDGRAGGVEERGDHVTLSREGASEGWHSSLPLWTPELSLRGAERLGRLAVAGFRPATREHRARWNVDKLA